jgi:ligand-binding SRPBCC domain-containing protein
MLNILSVNFPSAFKHSFIVDSPIDKVWEFYTDATFRDRADNEYDGKIW